MVEKKQLKASGFPMVLYKTWGRYWKFRKPNPKPVCPVGSSDGSLKNKGLYREFQEVPLIPICFVGISDEGI